MKSFVIASGVAVIASMAAASSAQAAYFIRPVLQYSGELVDGYEANGSTSGVQAFNDGTRLLEAAVDLGAGTIRTYGQVTGPSSEFAIVTGIMGERIRYTGPSDTPVVFTFDYDGFIDANQFVLGEGEASLERYIGIQAHLAVYNAGDATYLQWTETSTNASKALYVASSSPTFSYSEGSAFEFVNNSDFYGELNLVSGQYYDVYAAFNILMRAGPDVGLLTMDFSNTSTIGITPPEGGSFTSSSGEFLGFAQTPGGSAVPEPASWAMLIAGFGLVGAAMRRRVAAIA